jgi:hypothetical protein
MHKIDIMRFIEVKKPFWDLEFLLPTFITERKAEYHLEVSENNVVIFFHPSSRIP